MINNPSGIRFGDLKLVCKAYFGEPRINGSHHYYKVPWEGDPRVCIQEKNGRGKTYQVKQVVEAIKKIKEGESDV